MSTSLKLATVSAVLLGAVACDYSGDWLFDTEVEGVPGVIHLGELVPADVDTPASIANNVIYGEVGPTGTSEPGGVTFTFVGTGGHVCLFVDPETVYWNQSVSAIRPTGRYAYPDNVFDDGDLDLYAGLTAYYNGSPGERVGNFEVRYEDGLGNPVTVALNECTISSMTASTGGHSGRGAPEYCTVFNTQPGASYMVLMETWSTPLDDSRLSYGLLVTNGTCDQLQANSPAALDECVILGESTVLDAPGAPGPWYGPDEVPSRPGSAEVEQLVCATRGDDLRSYCELEAEENDCNDPDVRCFCGNPDDTPQGGSF